MKIFRTGILSLFALGAFASGAYSQTFIDPEFSGVTQYDGWEHLNATNYPGYGAYPGGALWPSPIGSNTPGSGDAEFDKTAGNGYPLDLDSGDYIYVSGGFSYDAAIAAGSFQIADSNVVAGLKNVFLQTFIGGAAYLDDPSVIVEFANDVYPVLSINGEAQNWVADNYIYFGSIPLAGIGYGDGYAYLRGFQWDLSSVLDPITSIEITWSNSPHAQIYALQLDQSTVYTEVIPEPSTMAYLALLCVGMLIFYCKNRTKNLISE